MMGAGALIRTLLLLLHAIVHGTGLPHNGTNGTGLPYNGTDATWLEHNGTDGTWLPYNGTTGTGLEHNGTNGTWLPYNGTSGTGLEHNGTSGTGLPYDGTYGTGLDHDGTNGTGLPCNDTYGTGPQHDGTRDTWRPRTGRGNTSSNLPGLMEFCKALSENDMDAHVTWMTMPESQREHTNILCLATSATCAERRACRSFGSSDGSTDGDLWGLDTGRLEAVCSALNEVRFWTQAVEPPASFDAEVHLHMMCSHVSNLEMDWAPWAEDPRTDSRDRARRQDDDDDDDEDRDGRDADGRGRRSGRRGSGEDEDDTSRCEREDRLPYAVEKLVQQCEEFGYEFVSGNYTHDDDYPKEDRLQGLWFAAVFLLLCLLMLCCVSCACGAACALLCIASCRRRQLPGQPLGEAVQGRPVDIEANPNCVAANPKYATGVPASNPVCAVGRPVGPAPKKFLDPMEV